MKRNLGPMKGAITALLLGIATSASASGSEAGSATVESAGNDGGRTIHTAQVESAAAPATADGSGNTTSFALIAVLGAGALATALVLNQRRQTVSSADGSTAAERGES